MRTRLPLMSLELVAYNGKRVWVQAADVLMVVPYDNETCYVYAGPNFSHVVGNADEVAKQINNYLGSYE